MKNGGVGNQTPCLSEALYHMSYIPIGALKYAPKYIHFFED